MTDGTEPEPRSDDGGASRDVPSDHVDGPPERIEAPAENVERVRVADDHGRRGAGRQAALLGVVFVATLILLLGATAVIRQGPAGSIGPSASAAAMAPGSVTPSPSPSGAGSASSPTATPSAGTAPGSPTAAVSSGPSAAPTVPTTTPLPSPATLVGAGDIG